MKQVVIAKKAVKYSIPMSKIYNIEWTNIYDKYNCKINPPAFTIYLSLVDSNGLPCIVSKPYKDTLAIGKVLPYIHDTEPFYRVYINIDIPLGNLVVSAMDDIVSKNKDNSIADFQIIFTVGNSSYKFEDDLSHIEDILVTMMLKHPKLRFAYEDFYSAYLTGETSNQYAFNSKNDYQTQGEVVNNVAFRF